MDVCVLLTYRCTSKCSMCYVWQHPTRAEDEVSLDTLDKIPSGICYLNLTGGEPTLRKDLPEIVDLLYPKAMQLEISSNGLQWERLEPIISKYPDIKIRFSVEGPEDVNNKIRGEKGGYSKKIKGLFRLKELGASDIGISTVIQDDNAEEIVELFHFAKKNGFEFATSTLHNGFQFHKTDNVPYDRLRIARHMGELITEMLRGFDVKNWFRAYLNLGLMAKILGQKRLLECTAGSELVFIDPWSDVYACNVRPDFKLGNLKEQQWTEIMNGPAAADVRNKISSCSHNCWMVGSAKTAMRHPRYPRLPSMVPLRWVIHNKLNVFFGRGIDFDKYVDFQNVPSDERAIMREFFLGRHVKRMHQHPDETHYKRFGKVRNR